MIKGCFLVGIIALLLSVTVGAGLTAYSHPDGRLFFGMIAGWGLVLTLVLLHFVSDGERPD
jgi:hypothetical protein